jgi:hypothetical protein
MASPEQKKFEWKNEQRYFGGQITQIKRAGRISTYTYLNNHNIFQIFLQ